MSDEILRQGDPRGAKLDRLRAEIADLNSRMTAIEKALLPPADVRESLERHLKVVLAGPGGWHGFGRFRSPPHKFHTHEWPGEPTWGALVAVLGFEQVIDAIQRHIEQTGGEVGLPLAERPAALEKLRTKLEMKERAEELECVALEAQGLTVLRRFDLDVQLVLSVHRGLGESEAAPSAPAKARLEHDDGAMLHAAPSADLR